MAGIPNYLSVGGRMRRTSGKSEKRGRRSSIRLARCLRRLLGSFLDNDGDFTTQNDEARGGDPKSHPKAGWGEIGNDASAQRR
jgi:hypothetical protein